MEFQLSYFKFLKDDVVKVLHSTCQKNWKPQQWPQDWKRSVFIPISKKSNAKEYSNKCTIAHISHTSKVMLKILPARLQQYVNRELPDVQLDLEKAEEPEIKLPTSVGSSKSKRISENIYFCFIDYAKAFDCVDHNKLWKILKEMGIPDDLTCLLRNLYAGQEATVRKVRKQQLQLDMEQQTGSKLRKEYVKPVHCHPAYLTYMQSTS